MATTKVNGSALAWLMDFAASAQRSDRLEGHPDHVLLLSAGLLGEAGSVLAELKKAKRERDAYPAYRDRMREEIGDFLWYFARLCDSAAPELLAGLRMGADHDGHPPLAVGRFLQFGAAVGDVLRVVREEQDGIRPKLERVWDLLQAIAREANVELPDAAKTNTRKTSSIWPSGERHYAPLFDDEFVEDEQLPRRLQIDFKERLWGERHAVILRCNGINFGDRLTDNIQDPDGYRYHDIFHFAYAVHLGWSPVIRALLRCKRKSSPDIDEAEDGARAEIIDEAVSAIIFSRAKQLNFFDGLSQVDYDLLKTVTEIVRGYEVERVPLWQWEAAILDGYAIFRQLRVNRGGRVAVDLEKRQLTYIAPT